MKGQNFGFPPLQLRDKQFLTGILLLSTTTYQQQMSDSTALQIQYLPCQFQVVFVKQVFGQGWSLASLLISILSRLNHVEVS